VMRSKVRRARMANQVKRMVPMVPMLQTARLPECRFLRRTQKTIQTPPRRHFISKEEPHMDDGVSDTSNTTTKKSKEEPDKEDCANGAPTKEEEEDGDETKLEKGICMMLGELLEHY
jgi:hypothetical protein